MGKGMKAGKRPRQRQGNMQAQLQQMQAMQAMMEKTQEEIEQKEFEVSSGGGAVTVKMNGKRELLDVSLQPEAVDPDDVEMLEDLIMTAVNEAIRQVAEYSETEMSKVTGGINIPGL
ncbi:MAG: YbaB/EbfC family nucleoid-associated protein [Eubacteriales bacterium]|nr:YbaB/EbfC family nucleoid-associated protein [Eubacteriales bacterium]